MATLTRGLDFKVVKAADIPLKGTQARRSRYAATVGEFMRSGAQSVEIEEFYSSTAYGVANSLNAAAQRLGVDRLIHARTRSGRVFIVRRTA